jgi:hypothetical protein
MPTGEVKKETGETQGHVNVNFHSEVEIKNLKASNVSRLALQVRHP